MAFKDERRSLLSSGARVQVPWIKVTIGNYTFGVYSRVGVEKKNDNDFYQSTYHFKYPSFVKSLDITTNNSQGN